MWAFVAALPSFSFEQRCKDTLGVIHDQFEQPETLGNSGNYLNPRRLSAVVQIRKQNAE